MNAADQAQSSLSSAWLDEEVITAATRCKIAVFITFHFRPQRLSYLSDMLRVLGEYPVSHMEIYICTNTSELSEITTLRRLFKFLLVGEKLGHVITCSGLTHAFDLTWSHKPLLEAAFTDSEKSFTHFIYLEDDIRFSFTNFLFFLKFSEPLSKYRLIPGFVRVEFNYKEGDLFLSDCHAPMRINDRNAVDIGGIRFVNSDYPYMAMFVLNRTQMGEYISSRSFNKTSSESVCDWWIAERAAMGLTWEAVPPGFTSRIAIPIDPSNSLPLPVSLIHHIPNNYTNDYTDRPEYVFGRLNVVDAFKAGNS